MNKNAKFEGVPVHGLLRRKFAFDETLQASATRETFMADMIRGTWFSPSCGLIFFHSDK